MRLTKKNQETLLGLGHRPEDLGQIAEALATTRCLKNGRRVSKPYARERLGDEKFLAGLGRAAFHASASQIADNGTEIQFDNRKMFETQGE